MKNLVKEFESPGAAYRGKPFWAWNGKLTEAELRRQVRVMKRMGLGGGFMHSRVGLATPYLSEEWFNLTNAVIDECKKQGMEAWLYDEDRWPSGAAGGLVTKDAKYRQKRLRLEIDESGKAPTGNDVVATFAARMDGDTVAETRRLKKGQKPDRGEVAFVFRRRLSEPSDWYNGQTYLDTMSHEAVRRFIEVTHKAYERECGKEFGKAVPGIFTDEPNHGATLQDWKIDQLKTAGTDLPWTDALPKMFRQRYGYDLLDHLPEVFFDVGGRKVTRARYHFHDCLAFLFVDAFARQIGEWCDENEMLHTGHLLSESPLSSNASVCSTSMRFYEYMQAPGIDILRKQIEELDTAKACSSVARQCGRKWVLSELYGVTGWEFSFADHKLIGDWQAALGINLRCQHLSWYTMEGDAKRDYPASILHQSPWWEEYAAVEDYFSRVHVLMTQGEPVRDILVIHPMESVWTRCRVGWLQSSDVHELNANMQNLRDWLLDANLDFDYGDEEMMSRLGRIRKGGPDPIFQVGKAQYKVVVVPPLITMRKTTVDLLRRFAKAGGQVVFLDDPACYVDARPSGDVVDLAGMCEEVAFSRRPVVAALENVRTISILDSKGKQFAPALYQLRRDGDTQYVFICTRNETKDSGPLTILLPDGKSVEEWDGQTGERFLADFKADARWVTIRSDLPGCGSRLFVIRNRKSTLKPRPKSRQRRVRTLNPKSWDVLLNEPNALVLDCAEYRTDGGKWQPAAEILRVDRAIREAAGFILRGGRRLQPWATPPSKKKPIGLELRFRFKGAAVPSGSLALALEHPEEFAITVNGKDVSIDGCDGWWVDTCIETVPLDASLLRKGANEICLKTAYGELDNLEAAFLLGDFGVKLAGRKEIMVALPQSLRLGNWVRQGLPFYSGAVTYRTAIQQGPAKGERVVVQLPKYAAACVRILVDGKSAGVIAWPPHEADITDLLTGEKQELGIQVISSRRNSFGPLHRVPPAGQPTGPPSFVTAGPAWTDDYSLVPYGLLAPPKLIVRRS